MTGRSDQASDDCTAAESAVCVVRGPSGATIILCGDIDDDNREAVEAELTMLVDGGVDRIVFDLSEIRFADSSLLNLMIRARAMLLGRGTVVIGGPVAPAVTRLFEITGVGDLFHHHTGVEAALEAEHG